MKNTKKILSIIILLIGFSLLGIGIFLTLKEDRASSSNPKDKELTIEEQQQANKVKVSSNEKLREKKCFENICIDNVEISSLEDKYFSITGNITNEGTVALENKVLKLIFDLENGEYSTLVYVGNLPSGSSMPLEEVLEDSSIFTAKSYKIENPTEAEITEFLSGLMIME